MNLISLSLSLSVSLSLVPPYDQFIYIIQGYVTDTGALGWLYNDITWTMDDMGIIDQYPTTTKHDKAPNVYRILVLPCIRFYLETKALWEFGRVNQCRFEVIISVEL